MTRTGEHRFFNVCAKIALKNLNAKKVFNFGAVIVKGGSVISTGCNKPRTDPLIDFLADRYKGAPQQVHAEIDCLSGVQRHNIRGCVLYVARVNVRDMTFRIAKPCAMCKAFLIKHKLKKVFYSINGDVTSGMLEYGVLELRKET